MASFTTQIKDEVSKILDIQIADLSKRLLEKDLRINLTESAKDYLIEHGYDPSMGARPMRRLIQKEIEDPIAMSILEGIDSTLKQICIDCTNNNLSVNFEQLDDKQIRCFTNPVENSVLK